MKKRIIINGANGYVASNFINELLRHEEYDIIALVRAGRECSAEERLKQTLAEINNGVYGVYPRLKVYGYSLLDERFALSDEFLQQIFGADGVDYYHFAASLKFDLKSKDEIFATNVDGVNNSLQIFTKYARRDARFFYVSTAYSCGKMAQRFEERFYPNEGIEAFRNYYEQSKRFAENIVRRYMEEWHLNAHILRLSQVVGHSRTGVTHTDYGIFDFSRRLCNIARKNPYATVRIKVNTEGTQNLIPIDILVSYLLRTVEETNLPVILNLVATKAVKNQHILDALHQLMPLNIIPDMSLRKEEMNSLERLIAVGMSFTGSYTSTDLPFDTTSMQSLNVPVSYDDNQQMVYKMLKYFLNEKYNLNFVPLCIPTLSL